ncbi:MAG: ribulose-phosphate 3-epimerase [Desulfobacterales bacterium]
MKPQIAPSILSADFTRLGQELRDVEAAGADLIHVDVMDGHFVPNISYGPIIVEAVKRVSQLPIDVHLMIEKPERYIEDFAQAGAHMISVHVETCPHLNRTLHQIQEAGCRAGAVLNPATPLTTLEWVLEIVNFVLIMSVNPGFGGQSFIPNSLERIQELRETLKARKLDVQIQIDGGVNSQTAPGIIAAGADILVAGSAIFGRKDYAEAIRAILGE